MRCWVDLTNSAHVLVLRPLVELLEQEGHEVTLTARPLSHTLELLEDWGHPHVVLGRYGGARRIDKGRAALDRVAKLVRFARRRGFGCALAHGSTELPVACRLLGIPNTTMLDYEWASIQHGLNCRLANRVLAPEAIPARRLRRLGARPSKLIRYPGLKEEYYLHDFEPDPGMLEKLGIDRERMLCVVRTAPGYALYLRGARDELLPRVLRRLSEAEGVQTVVLTRTGDQADEVEGLGLEGLTVPRRAVDGRSLVAFADVLVSGGGTMNREAAVLGTPAWSIFEGRLGAVDAELVREGRLRLLTDPGEIRLERKAPGALRDRRRRDPAELLRLALPWARESAR
jgi:uncharacterized protein